MSRIKITVEKLLNGYIAYPTNIKGVIVVRGHTYEEALMNVKSALRSQYINNYERVESADSPPLIEMKNIQKYYNLGETRIPALKGVDFALRKGEFVAIWGPSGSGKSTLCNLIGMIDTPTEGSLTFDGKDVIDLSDNERSNLRNLSIGFVFQNFNLIPVLSALENVMLPLQIRGESAGKARQKAIEGLVEVGLGDRLSQRPDKLSGGQRQRVAVARALITDPSLVIADEPTANLDSENARKIIDLMRQINSTKGATFIFSTHDQRLLDRVKRRVRLEDGSIVEDERFQIGKRW